MPNSRTSSQRMQAAGIRAMDAHQKVARAARRLCAELDEVTSPHGIPVTELSDEDSMVISVVAAKDTLVKAK